MPIRKGINRVDAPQEASLRRDLVAEFEDPKDEGEPLILIDQVAAGTKHL